MNFREITLQVLLKIKQWIALTPFQRYKENNSFPPQSMHSIWHLLLGKYVDNEGWVDYKGFQLDRKKLQTYLKILSENPPNDKNWSRAERLAYWINTYNAFTIELILRHYPIMSIRDIAGKIPLINSSWDIKFFKINGIPFDLNIIEHEILRKEFDEPRIHFAIVCASISCPRLLNQAYEANRLEEQLELQTRFFINNPKKNILSENHVKLSGILDWYKSDFPKNITTIEYINQYTDIDIQPNAKVEFLDYNWKLNGNV